MRASLHLAWLAVVGGCCSGPAVGCGDSVRIELAPAYDGCVTWKVLSGGLTDAPTVDCCPTSKGPDCDGTTRVYLYSGIAVPSADTFSVRARDGSWHAEGKLQPTDVASMTGVNERACDFDCKPGHFTVKWK